jgi:phosphatidylserine/phosphatidylglycerophosphate/cardiolipin synthase-like enzyme
VPRHADGYNTDCDPEQAVDMYSHQKYMTISGHYGDDRAASMVFTGSSNWTHSGLVGDEIILRANGAHLVDQWDANFDYIWNHRSRPVGDSPGPGFYPTPPYCPYTTSAGRRTTVRATTTSPTFTGRFWEGD